VHHTAAGRRDDSNNESRKHARALLRCESGTLFLAVRLNVLFSTVLLLQTNAKPPNVSRKAPRARNQIG
jgi:hypothetical protein